MSRLSTEGLTLGYGQTEIVKGVSLTIPDNSFTVIVGANGSGKSTLLRGLARLIAPKAGAVLLDDKPLGHYRSRELARTIGLLPQRPTAPEGITVRDLVGRGRFPHQSLLRQWSPEDQTAVEEALEATGLTRFADHALDELSGGQAQRAWISMALAQQTDILLLDEPTTYLDIAHQIEVLELCASQRWRHGTTLVAVLHDLNLACRYATHLVALKDGEVVGQGTPDEVITADLVESVFGLPCRVIPDPESGTPLVIPRFASGSLEKDGATP